MTAQPKRSWTVEEYLTFERSSDVKHEYVAGDVFAMAGATATHNIIVANIIASLHAQTRQRDCTVFPSDMRLKIVSYNSYTYPDVTVVCGEIRYEDEHQDTLLNPTLIVEVLSPSTEQHDRGRKSQYYRSIPSLKEYILVSQHEPHVEHFVRHSDYQWLFTETSDLRSAVHLPAIGCTLALADIYDRALLRLSPE